MSLAAGLWNVGFLSDGRVSTVPTIRLKISFTSTSSTSAASNWSNGNTARRSTRSRDAPSCDSDGTCVRRQQRSSAGNSMWQLVSAGRHLRLAVAWPILTMAPIGREDVVDVSLWSVMNSLCRASVLYRVFALRRVTGLLPGGQVVTGGTNSRVGAVSPSSFLLTRQHGSIDDDTLINGDTLRDVDLGIGTVNALQFLLSLHGSGQETLFGFNGPPCQTTQSLPLSDCS